MPKPHGLLVRLPAQERRLAVTHGMEIEQPEAEVFEHAPELLKLLESGMEGFDQLQLMPGQLLDLTAQFLQGIAVAGGELVHFLIELFVGRDDRALQRLKLLDERTDAGQQFVRLFDCEDFVGLFGRQLA
jgi:hypothetical protein